MMARVSFEDGKISKIGFSLVRQNDNTEVEIRPVAEEQAAIAEIQQMSKRFGTRLALGRRSLVMARAPGARARAATRACAAVLHGVGRARRAT